MPNPSHQTRNPVAPPALGLERRAVRVVAYDPRWPEWFAAEAARLRDALGNRVGKIEHIGSTAIPGLPAKPILDMMASVDSLEEAEQLIPALQELGHEWGPRDMQDVPDRRYFVRHREDGASTHHLSLAAETSYCWRSQLAFRDYLRANAEARETYARLKRDLALRFPQDRGSYIDGKTAFVAEIMTAAAVPGRAERNA